MGSLYRSEEMRFCQLIVEKDAAFAAVAELGKHSCLQFKDIIKDGMTIGEKVDDGNYEIMPQAELNQMESTVRDLESDVINMNESDALLKRNFADLKEWDAVLEKTDAFFSGGIDDQATVELEEQEERGRNTQEKLPIQYVVGVLHRERIATFERVLWRAGHHTAYVRTSDIEEALEDPDTGEKVNNSVFIVFYKGDRLRNIINKVADGFKAKLFANCPRTSKDRQSSGHEVRTCIADLKTVIGQTGEHRCRVLQAASNNLVQWLKQVNLQKSCYHTLNLFNFDGIGRFFVAECWIPLRDIDRVRESLERSTEATGSAVRPVLNVLETSDAPPTYNKTNKFTEVFQSIVDAYGVASYLEVNPAPFIIISFPFLFACMFGDLGHGLLMLIAGLYLVLREKNLLERSIKDEIFGIFFGGRYIILLMGIFSIHAGFVYNDLFAKSFNIFGSSWRNYYDTSNFTHWVEEEEKTKKELILEASMSQYNHSFLVQMNPGISYQHSIGPYPFGVDPVWNIAENKLNFLNSMKMKLSVLLGIGQMTFGLILSLQNHRFFKPKIEIFTVFIPQMLFMFCIFVYLCLQIIAKWLFFWVEEKNIFGRVYPGSHCAPSLLIGLINMFMFKTRASSFVNESMGKHPVGGHEQWAEVENCYLSQWYPGQSTIEAILVIVAGICVPIMLFGKPIQFYLEQKKQKKAHEENISVRANILSEETEVIMNGSGSKGEEHQGGGVHHGETLGDVMVYQSIHTIEYVLGCVSHTASYLRLWALSLAHAQLSEVLWHMVLANSFNFSHNKIVGAIAIYIIFFVFAILTFSILVLMEGLSAFLHALRLHWMEFQSKFYLGLGYAFVPFSFRDRLSIIEVGASS